MKHRYWVLCFLVCFNTSLARRTSILRIGDNTKLVVDVQRVEACNNSWNQLKLYNFKSNIINQIERSVDLDGYVLSGIQKMTNFMVKIKMCREAVSFNTCENIANFRFGDKACDMLKDQNSFWTPYVAAITPEMRCPIRTNVIYKTRNATIDTEILKKMGVRFHDIIWVGVMSGSNEEGKNWGCAIIEAKTTTAIRKRN